MNYHEDRVKYEEAITYLSSLDPKYIVFNVNKLIEMISQAYHYRPELSSGERFTYLYRTDLRRLTAARSVGNRDELICCVFLSSSDSLTFMDAMNMSVLDRNALHI